MFEYKFVKLDMDHGFITSQPSKDYHPIIDEHARDGGVWFRFLLLRSPRTEWPRTSS